VIVPTPNTLTGAFTNLVGNAIAMSNGFLEFVLNQEAVVTGTGIIVCPGKVIKITLNSAGAINAGQTLWPNDLLTPVNSNNQNQVSFYTVTAFTESGQRVWGPYAQTVLSTPSPFLVTVWIPGQLV
jgi:hypothetical protein